MTSPQPIGMCGERVCRLGVNELVVFLGGAACSMPRMATPSLEARSVEWENPCSEGRAGQRVEAGRGDVEAPPVVAILEILHSLCSSLQRSINPIKAPLFCLHDERHPRCPARNVIKNELGFLGTGSQKPRSSRGDIRSHDLQRAMRES